MKDSDLQLIPLRALRLFLPPQESPPGRDVPDPGDEAVTACVTA